MAAGAAQRTPCTSRRRRVALLTAGTLLLSGWAGLIRAQGDLPNLKSAPANARVNAAQYCAQAGQYRFTFADGATRAWPEFAVMLKLDATDQGPAPGTAVLLPARGPGDRVLVIFNGLDDLKRMLQPGC